MNIDDILKNDLPIMLKEIGKSVIYGSYSTFGRLYHDPTEALTLNTKEYSIHSTTLTIIIAKDSIGTIKNNTPILIDGKQYTIDNHIIMPSGLEEKLWLVGA